MLFKAKYEIKRRIYDKIIYKAMKIPVELHQTNKYFYVIVKPKNVCKLEFADHLWLPFLDQPQSNIVVFSIITFDIYNILVKKWRHIICPNDIITFN